MDPTRRDPRGDTGPPGRPPLTRLPAREQTSAEATARLIQDWDADIAAYDDIHLHILTMADALADGIVQQFPERFSA